MTSLRQRLRLGGEKAPNRLLAQQLLFRSGELLEFVFADIIAVSQHCDRFLLGRGFFGVHRVKDGNRSAVAAFSYERRLQ
jgi:hypothetical protein